MCFINDNKSESTRRNGLFSVGNIKKYVVRDIVSVSRMSFLIYLLRGGSNFLDLLCSLNKS